MGGVANAFNDILGGGSSQNNVSMPTYPAAPNYTSAAQATAAGNLINQNTPWGSLSYNQSGTDQFGNPIYSANQSLSPALQNATNNAQNAVSNYSFGSFNPTNLPSTGINPGQTYQQAEMSILQPQLDRQRSQTQTQLANQGIQPGSEAYNNAMYDLNNNQNNLLANVTTQGIGVGLNANQQAYNQQLNSYNTNLNAPFTYANDIKNLSTPSYVQTPSGPNYLGATTALGNYNLGTYGNQLGAYNASLANATNQANGLLGLGGTLGAASLMSPAGTFAWLSDIRVKENIKHIGMLSNGLPFYEFEYKPEWKNTAGHGKFVGVMAQEVEKLIPDAVITRNDGYKMVDYSLI